MKMKQYGVKIATVPGPTTKYTDIIGDGSVTGTFVYRVCESTTLYWNCSNEASVTF